MEIKGQFSIYFDFISNQKQLIQLDLVEHKNSTYPHLI